VVDTAPMRAPSVLAAAVVASLAVSAAQAPPEVQPIVIFVDAVIDVREGRTLPDAVIVVRGDRIETVGPRLSIDAHVHLALAGTPADNARLTVEAGFTTVADLGAIDDSMIKLRDAINAGKLPGPRVVAAGRWIGVSGGTCDFSGIGVRGAHAFRARVEEEVRRGADIIKVCVSGWLADARKNPTNEISDEELTAAIETAYKYQRRVAVHAISEKGIATAVRLGADLVVHGGFADPATVKTMRQRAVYMLPTLFSFTRSQPEADVTALKAHLSNAVRQGLPVAFGTDAGVIRHGNNAREFETLQDLGLSPIEVLRAATLHAARALGMGKTIGSIEKGASADIVALDGDPLRDITAYQRPTFVMVQGRIHRRQ
jgi:imidazolonepropionase-like amidohydrolase